MKGYIRVLQWYSHVRTLKELNDPTLHTGDARAIDSLLGFSEPRIEEQRPWCGLGEVVMRIEDDESLTIVATNYDTSD